MVTVLAVMAVPSWCSPRLRACARLVARVGLVVEEPSGLRSEATGEGYRFSLVVGAEGLLRVG